MSNTEKYNTKLSQLAGLATAFASEIENDENLKLGEKFLLLQRFFGDTAKMQKSFDIVKKEIEEYAKTNLADNGSGKSPEVQFEGASVLVKYSYPKPTLDSEKLKTELERAYSEIGADFDELQFVKESTPRKQVIIQSII
jgi:hypothetical protein